MLRTLGITRSMIVSQSSVRVAGLVFKLLSLMATDAGVTNITSTRVQYIFWDAVRSSCCLCDADLIFKGIFFFFVGQWCHGSVGERTPGFFFLLPEQYRFASIKSNLSL